MGSEGHVSKGKEKHSLDTRGEVSLLVRERFGFEFCFDFLTRVTSMMSERVHAISLTGPEFTSTLMNDVIQSCHVVSSEKVFLGYIHYIAKTMYTPDHYTISGSSPKTVGAKLEARHHLECPCAL